MILHLSVSVFYEYGPRAQELRFWRLGQGWGLNGFGDEHKCVDTQLPSVNAIFNGYYPSIVYSEIS